MSGSAWDQTVYKVIDVLDNSQIEIPQALGWDFLNFPIYPSVTESQGLAPQFGSAGVTPEQLFGSKSTALSNPFATFYVATSGNDANDGLTPATAVRSIGKGQALANATGQPCKVIVTLGTYARSNNPRFNSSVAVVANDTAQIWADTIKIDMPSGARAYTSSLTAGAIILRRNCYPVRQPDAGGGTFGSY